MQRVIDGDIEEIWSKLFIWSLAILSLAILLIKFAVPTTSSNDLWWHMAIGRHILETGRLIVDHSIFTWTEATSYHTYNAWLSEILLYLIYSVTGQTGLISLRYLVLGGFFFLAAHFAIQRKVVYNPLTWVIITLGIALCFILTSVRPELFSFMFMTLTVWLYFYVRKVGVLAWRLLYLFPVIILLWVNSHGAFVMAAPFFLSIGIGESLNARFNIADALPVKLRIHLFIALNLCIVALLINPYGYHLPLDLLQNIFTTHEELSELATQLTGWDPTTKYNSAPNYAVDYFVIAAAIFVLLIWHKIKNLQVNAVIVLAFLAYSLIFFKLVRNTHFLAPIFVFSCLDLLADQKNSLVWPSGKLAKLTVAILCMILMVMSGWRTINKFTCTVESRNFLVNTNIQQEIPIEEADFIAQSTAIKKLGNTYEDGSYLLYRLWPNVLISIDPRYFPFKTWYEQYHMFENGRNVKNFLVNHEADAWLINYKYSALIHWFSQSRSWRVQFIGPAGILFVPASTSNQLPIISPNVEYASSVDKLLQLFQTAAALQNWPLATRIQHHTTTIATNNSTCTQYAMLAQDMQNLIVGMNAFYSGDYATAAANLRRNSKDHFIDSTNITISALTFLAKHAWDANDYAGARTHAIDALGLSPKNVASVYNVAITDWQYMNLNAEDRAKVSDDITWQFLVSILLKHQEKIPEAQKFIVDVLTAMLNGTLQTKPPFIIPSAMLPKQSANLGK